MKKAERIKKYGKKAYEKALQQAREWDAAHPKELKASKDNWVKNHPEEMKAARANWRKYNSQKVKENGKETSRKGGKYYEKHKLSHKEGLTGEKEMVRRKHRKVWSSYKQIIAPKSQIHHEWIPGTADYRGVALVEKDPHQYGIIDPIVILEGEITLLTEAEIRGDK